MNNVEAQIRDTLVNIQRFLDANGVALAPVNMSGARQDLDEAVAALGIHAVRQLEHAAASAGETRKERAIRASIRRQFLRPIAQVARARAGDVPQLGSLQLPRINLLGARFVDAANAVANSAEPYAAELVSAGLKPDFLTGLRARLHELEASLRERVGHVQVRKSATIALAAAAAKGRHAIRGLDAAIEQHSPDDVQVLAEWRSVKRLAKKPGPLAAG